MKYFSEKEEYVKIIKLHLFVEFKKLIDCFDNALHTPFVYALMGVVESS